MRLPVQIHNVERGNPLARHAGIVPLRKLPGGTVCAPDPTDPRGELLICCTDFGYQVCCGRYDQDGNNYGFGCYYPPTPFPTFCFGGVCYV
jgi:hypothetical protein